MIQRACERRVLVVRLERVRERLDGREERALEALVARGALERELRLLGEPAEEVELAIAVGLGLGHGRGDDAPAPVDREGRDREPSVGVLRRRRDRRVVLGAR